MSVDLTSKKSKILLRGFGSIGRQYANILAELGCTEIDVISNYPIDRNSLPEFKFITFVNKSEIRRADYDLVIIASETKSHLKDFEDLRRLGKNVLIEKPIASDLEDVKNYTRTLNSKKVFVSSPLRFYLNFEKLPEMINSLGELYSINVECKSWMPDWRPTRDYQDGYWADPRQGGVLRDLIHEIDYPLALFGLPNAVNCKLEFGTESEPFPVDTKADLNWITSTGADVRIHLDYFSRKSSRAMTVNGEKGEIHWDLLNGRLEVKDNSRKVRFSNSEKTLPSDALYRQVSSVLLESEKFYPSSVQEAINALAIVDAGRKADLNQQESVVAYIDLSH